MNRKVYEEQYAETSFRKKGRKNGHKAGTTVLEPALKLYYASRDSDTPAWARTTIYAALGYFSLPVDAIPDFLPAAGYTDDLGVLVAAVATVGAHVKEEHVDKARATLKRWFG